MDQRCGILFVKYECAYTVHARNIAIWSDFTDANFSDGKYRPLTREISPLEFILSSGSHFGRRPFLSITNGYLTYVYFSRGRSREVYGWPSPGVYARRNHIGYHPATAQIEFPITRLSCRSNVYFIAVG